MGSLRRALISLMVVIISINMLSSSQLDNLPQLIISGSPGGLISYLHLVRKSGYRLILSEDPEGIADVLSKKLNLPIKVVREVNGSEDEILREMRPHELAYALVYASRLDRELRASDLMNLSRGLSRLEIRKPEGSDLYVAFFSSDGIEYAFLAAYVAVLKDAPLLDMEEGFEPSILKGASHVIVVTKPLWRGNYQRYNTMLKYFTEVDGDPYLDVSFGLLTGNKIDAPFLMLLWEEVLRGAWSGRMMGVSLLEDLPLARKVELVSRSMGFTTEVYHPDLNYSNLTEEKMKSILETNGGLLYLSLHGNPYVMALRSDSHPVLSARTIRQVSVFGSLIITLSCDTLSFSDIENPRESLAYSFIDSGALAYVGSMKVELTLGSELGTSYPDLLIALLSSGSTLGEAVMTVNNLRIKASRGDPEAANEVLLGDPTLRLRNPKALPFTVERMKGKYVIETKEDTPLIFLRVNESGKEPSVKSDMPYLHLEWYEDERGIFIYITTLSTSYAGYFKPGSEVELEMIEKMNLFEVLPYFILILMILIILRAFLRKQ